MSWLSAVASLSLGDVINSLLLILVLITCRR